MNNDFTFYFGAASGSARKALQQLEEPNIMLNWETKNNQPWDAENLFIDSGGYSLLQKKSHHEWADDYIDYVERADPAYFALQDYPCEQEVLEEHDRTVFMHQGMTAEASAHTLAVARDRVIDAEPVCVLQGYEPSEYVSCIHRFERAGILTDYVGIGTLCNRNTKAEKERAKRIIQVVSDALPRKRIHAFGIHHDLLTDRAVVSALDSADSLAFDWEYDKDIPGPRWHQVAFNYLGFKSKIAEAVYGVGTDSGQNTTIAEL